MHRAAENDISTFNRKYSYISFYYVMPESIPKIGLDPAAHNANGAKHTANFVFNILVLL